MNPGTPVLTLPAPVQRAEAAKAGLISLALLSCGHFFIDLYSSALGAFQPVLVEKLHLSLKQAGILGGLLIFFSSVMQPAYGYLSDRFHTRMFSALAPAMAGIFISSLLIAPSYGWLLGMAALGGAGIASFHPQASAWATKGLETNKGRSMSIFISAGTLGMAAGPLYFSILISQLGPGRGLWSAVPGLIATFALLAFLPLASAPEAHLRRRVNWAALRAVWKPLTVLYFLVFIRSIVQTTFAQLLPLYLHRERGFSLTEANYALSLYLTFGAVGGFAGGQMADRFGGRAVIMISMIGCVPFLALFFLGHGVAALAGLALGGLILLFTIPVNVVMAQDLVPGQTGTVSALMMGFAWGMAGLLFIPLTGFVSDRFSLHSALASLLIFPVIGFFLAFGLPKRRIA